MSDLADDFREMRRRRREHREKHTEECPGCLSIDYRRDPSKLYPGQTCGFCGYTRPEAPPRASGAHQCGSCNRKFTTEQGMRDHRRMKHGAPQ